MTEFPIVPEEDGKRIVYVREVKTADLSDEIRARTGGLDHLYAIHAEGGEVLALVADRQQAFVVARQNALAPVSVH